MLGDRQELDVREAKVTDVIAELLGKLAVRQRTVRFLGHPAPRAQVNFVDRKRAAKRVAAGPSGYPGLVIEYVVGLIDPRGRRGRTLRRKRKRIALDAESAAFFVNLVLV